MYSKNIRRFLLDTLIFYAIIQKNMLHRAIWCKFLILMVENSVTRWRDEYGLLFLWT